MDGDLELPKFLLVEYGSAATVPDSCPVTRPTDHSAPAGSSGQPGSSGPARLPGLRLPVLR